MGRHKTISDDDVVRIARAVFREYGHTATTRQIAEAAGISEAVLYQRFGNKNRLFFAAMRPSGPDIEQLLGPEDPPGEALDYLHTLIVRLGQHFGEVIPLALRMMSHPSFDHADLPESAPNALISLKAELAKRLASLKRRGRIAVDSESVTAALLVSMAHDWALSHAFTPGKTARSAKQLKEMVDALWAGMKTGG
jgi:AcrR family transcriptional regulator